MLGYHRRARQNGDLQPDDFDGNGFEDAYPGYDPALSGAIPGTLPCTCGNNGTPAIPGDDCLGTDLILGTGDDSLGNCVVDATPTFHDDDPRGAPLSPLTPPVSPDPGLGPDGINGTADDVGGVANVALWGGVVILGKAPTNTVGASTGAPADAGDEIVEGSGAGLSVALVNRRLCRRTRAGTSGTGPCARGRRVGTWATSEGFTLVRGYGTVFDHNEGTPTSTTDSSGSGGGKSQPRWCRIRRRRIRHDLGQPECPVRRLDRGN